MNFPLQRDEHGTRVAIVIPVHKATPSEGEIISFRQCLRVLGDYPICFVMPPGLDTRAYAKIISEHAPAADVKYLRFPSRYFRSWAGYNRLLMAPRFYASFRAYTHILIYQLDCFVFRDELMEWCSRPYDFVGPPWFEGHDCSPDDAPVMGVGNGGLSLRTVASHRRALFSFSYRIRPLALWRRFVRALNWSGRLAHIPQLVSDLTVRNNTFFLFNDFQHSEDFFWARHVNANFKWFRVAPLGEALRFGFEVHPRRCYEKAGCLMPFGCHAWEKYDPDFWRPHIEAEGYSLPSTDVELPGPNGEMNMTGVDVPSEVNA